MARFKLTASACLNTPKGPAEFKAGSIIDTNDLLNFTATVWMTPLDAEATALLQIECARLRASYDPNYAGYGEIPGAGPVQKLPL